jgi:kynurenine formamidase
MPAAAGALERAMLGKSAVVDLTHAVSDGSMSSERPRPEVAGDEERRHSSGALVFRDLGTRFTANGGVQTAQLTVDKIPSRELLVVAVVVNVAAKVAQEPDYHVTVEDLRTWERQNGRIPKQSAVPLNTGWSRWWTEPTRYVNQDARGVARVPGFSSAAVAFLVGERQVRGLGLDAFIPDGPISGGAEMALPRTAPGVWQLENLVNLDRLPAKGAKLVVAPLRIEATNAPARVIAILP